MKILIIGKYPPIEGGTAARTYWLARMLGERGHQIALVTNAPRVESTYRTVFNLSELSTRREYEPQNVTIFALEKAPPQHIPYSEAYVSRLVNLGLRAIAEHGADVIFAYYLEPYAVAGLLLKELTGLPLVIQHAGSDIYRIFRNDDFSQLMGRVLQNADQLILARPLHDFALTLGIPPSRIAPSVGVLYPSAFSPMGPHFVFPDVSERVPIITYLGKTTLNKGLEEFFDALALVPKDARVYLFSNGPLREEFAERIAGDPSLVSRIKFMDFVAPWEVPSILRGSDLLLHLEHKFPIPIHSPIQPYEAILTQTPLLLSNEIFQKIEPLFPKTREQFLIVNPGDRTALVEKISYALENKPELKEHSAAIYSEFSLREWRNSVNVYEGIFSKVSRGGWFRRFAHFR